MRNSEGLTTERQIKRIKNFCCMQLDGISINIIASYTINSINLKENRAENSVEKEQPIKIDTKDFLRPQIGSIQEK